MSSGRVAHTFKLRPVTYRIVTSEGAPFNTVFVEWGFRSCSKSHISKTGLCGVPWSLSSKPVKCNLEVIEPVAPLTVLIHLSDSSIKGSNDRLNILRTQAAGVNIVDRVIRRISVKIESTAKTDATFYNPPFASENRCRKGWGTLIVLLRKKVGHPHLCWAPGTRPGSLYGLRPPPADEQRK